MIGKESLRIDVLCNDGSPLGVSEMTINGEDGQIGVGGAELAILTLMREWAKLGHQVTFYNNPRNSNGSIFNHAPISQFQPNGNRDILIVFRSPNSRAIAANGKKIWFSTDQYTVGNFADFARHVDKIVTISPFHAEYFRRIYQISKTITIDLPVRTWEYQKEIPKIPKSLLFCSVPTRGLDILAKCYPLIVEKVPDVSLTITSDFRLWGAFSPMNESYISKFFSFPNVRFLGAIPRKELINEQLQAEIHAYPCTYEELFCYASAECQTAGCISVTSDIGALSTTNMSILIPGDPNSSEWQAKFVSTIVSVLLNQERHKEAALLRKRAFERFSPNRILEQWNEVFYG